MTSKPVSVEGVERIRGVTPCRLPAGGGRSICGNMSYLHGALCCCLKAVYKVVFPLLIKSKLLGTLFMKP